MKYLILIYHNPASQQVWQGFSDDERDEGLRYYATLVEELAASGELVASEALADPSQAKRVAVHDGRTITSDGPFAEAKEHLAGFLLVDCDGIDRAVEHATRVPEAAFGLVEVRPVRGLDPEAWR
ncbi:MAG TPA: YciI family protein [Actinomycetes bacterium]